MNRLWTVLCTSITVVLIASSALSELRADTHAGGLTLYISPDGSDTAAGSLRDPVATIERAFELARQHRQRSNGETPAVDAQEPSGIQIVLREGRYELTDTLRIGGDELGPLTVSAHEKERAVISGGVTLPNNWKIESLHGKDIWTQVLPDVASGDWYFRQLWVNGRRAGVPVIPKDNGFLQIEDLVLDEADRGKPEAMWSHSYKDRFVYGSDAFDAGWHNLQDVWVMASYSWYHSYFKIKDIEDADRVVVLDKDAQRPLMVAHPAHGRHVDEHLSVGHDEDTFYEPAHYRIYNVFEALSEPGEFYLDRGTGKLYYVPRVGESPETTDVVAPRLNQLLVIKSSKPHQVRGLVFDGITFSHTTINPEKHDRTGNNYQNSGDGAIHYDGVADSAFYNCEFSHLGEYVMSLVNGSRDIDIIGNHFYDLGCGAIKTYGYHADQVEGATITPQTTMRLRITDNRIHEGTRFFPGYPAVNLNKTRNTILAFNEIYDFYFNGVHLGSRAGLDLDFTIVDSQVLHNHFHDLGQGHWTGNDMAAIYVNGVGLGVDLHDNLIHDINCTIYGGSGIYLDWEASYFSIKNNLIVNTNYDGMHIKGFANRIENNIVYATKKAFGQASDQTFEEPLAYVKHNVFVPTSSVIYNSMFVAPKALALSSGSNLLWSLERGPNVEVAQKGSFGQAYASRLWFTQWRDLTDKDKGSVIATFELVDPDNGDFRMTDQSRRNAESVGFVPFEVSAGIRRVGEREVVPFKPDNAAINSSRFKKHVALIQSIKTK